MTQVIKTKGLFAVRSVEPILDDWRHNPWLHEALKQIKACVAAGIFVKYPGVKVKPTWIPFVDEEQLGPPLRCTMNTQQYVKNNEGATILRCIKMFTDCNPNLRPRRRARGRQVRAAQRRAHGGGRAARRDVRARRRARGVRARRLGPGPLAASWSAATTASAASAWAPARASTP